MMSGPVSVPHSCIFQTVMEDNVNEVSRCLHATDVLARHLTFEGKSYYLHIARINPDDGSVSIAPFEQETPGTLYFDDPIILRRSVSADGRHSFAISVDR